jgi:hypothetical protein
MEFTPEWFDLSSRAWLANKKRSGYSYTYKCGLENCKNKVKNTLNCKHHEGQGIVLRGIVKATVHPLVGQMPNPSDVGQMPNPSGVATRSKTRINPKLLMQPN